MMVYKFVFFILRVVFKRDTNLIMENLALRSQLPDEEYRSIIRKLKKAKADDSFR